MEILQHLSDGFLIALQPLNLGVVILGVMVGLFIGAMPGLGSVNGVAILLPMTFLVPPTSAVMFLAAIYYGAMYGGAISSIMLGIPGASTAVATPFDGRPLRYRRLETGYVVYSVYENLVDDGGKHFERGKGRGQDCDWAFCVER